MNPVNRLASLAGRDISVRAMRISSPYPAVRGFTVRVRTGLPEYNARPEVFVRATPWVLCQGHAGQEIIVLPAPRMSEGALLPTWVTFTADGRGTIVLHFCRVLQVLQIVTLEIIIACAKAEGFAQGKVL